ncbi:MAG: type 2 isopentenyl-diphosphate Delta-isomerase [Archaeoglobaceae archaeon]|nr:type 2 isopentenyl-diphosphate Delta-isomerase [Archaeoglobaceae archaeon]MDW7989994.1 type 2 isopentenyl-diphosphate Delta-isomerase [Archaeoglobaceae archaeon]
MKTSDRKLDHIRICLTEEVESGYTGLEDVMLIHEAIPSTDFEKIDTNICFFEKKLSFPFLIASMTGGHLVAKEINENLATAVEEMGIGMGVGSQRAGIEEKEVEETFSIVRERAPKAFIYANIGLPQVIKDLEVVDRAIEMVEADAIAIHLNYLQEAVMREGDLTVEKGFSVIEEVCKTTKIPVIAKETGAGISREVALKLKEVGISAVDVGGKGGTSFSLVEAYRNEDETLKAVGFDFLNWGIPTAFCIVDCASTLPVIATGGIRNGIDVAKSIAIGAIVASSALPFLAPAKNSVDAVKRQIRRFMKGFKTAMFLCGTKKVQELRERPVFVTGNLLQWLIFRKINLDEFCRGGR